jgi:aminopeptidase N
MNKKNRSAAAGPRSSESFVAAVALVTLFAATSIGDASAQTVREAAAVLTIDEARARSARVSNVTYDLTFRLDGELSEYSGSVTAAFTLSDSEKDLTLDFDGGAIASVVVNDEAMEVAYNGFFLTLPAAALNSGANSVVIRFTRPYSADGSGLYRFRDPEDGRDYLYTDFEPYDQNRLFPSFDQPDLKARYATSVTVPAHWHVISIVAESAVNDGENSAEKTWVFPQSRPISTYIYALHAGEYHSWDSAAGEIPLRLFVRESLAGYVEPDDWFEFTRQGFAFYERYFEVPYPFGKYDQIIVPHFNAGAMENVGAVTFSERYLRRGAYTRQDRRAIASVVLHEMAHMWFGDLVTMRWWNGLWLNESFATFMSVLAMVENTEFTDEWQEAYLDTISAYEADERDTTHPIELAVPDTDSAFANFDRITYEKGSATLTQLNHLVGPEAFRRGVSNYLKTHAYGNTNIDDFLGAISAAAEQDLDDWAVDWLLEPGTNAIEMELTCRDDRIASLAVLQSAPDAWPTLRTHRTQLGLYDFDAGTVATRTLPVTYSGERTVVDAAPGQPCPDMVYGNHGDWDYVRVRLDPATLPSLADHLQGFEDALSRLMLWQSVWDMALDASISLPDYVDFALANISAESDESIERQVLGAIQSSLSYLTQIGDVYAGEILPRVEAYLWQQMTSSEPGSDRQLRMFDNYVRAVGTEAGVQRLAAIVSGTQILPNGLVIDQDRRWTALSALTEHGHADASRLLAAERIRDSGDEGRRRALSIDVTPPDLAVKRRWVAALLDPQYGEPLADFRARAAGLFPGRQHELQQQFTDTVLAALPEFSRGRDPAFLAPLVRGLLRPVCTPDYIERLDRSIVSSAALHPILIRELKDARFEAVRCLNIGARLSTSASNTSN